MGNGEYRYKSADISVIFTRCSTRTFRCMHACANYGGAFLIAALTIQSSAFNHVHRL